MWCKVEEIKCNTEHMVHCGNKNHIPNLLIVYDSSYLSMYNTETIVLSNSVIKWYLKVRII